MKSSNIKSDFHSLIDEMENEHLLMKFYDLMIKSRIQKEGELWEQLSDDQKAQLLLSEELSRDPKNLIDHDIQRNKHQKWL